jgi:hypothetical protein
MFNPAQIQADIDTRDIAMSYLERHILSYLQTSPMTFFSAAEVSRRAGTRQQFEANPHWALPILVNLLKKGAVEGDGSGRYRINGFLLALMRRDL